MPRHAKRTKHQRDTEMIAGLRKHRHLFRDLAAHALLSVDAVIARFQEHLDAMAEASQREIEWRTALEREARLEESIKELMARVKPMLQSAVGESNPKLREFGVKPYARRKPSMATLKLAVEKRRATRALRQTMGRRQRKRIKGG